MLTARGKCAVTLLTWASSRTAKTQTAAPSSSASTTPRTRPTVVSRRAGRAMSVLQPRRQELAGRDGQQVDGVRVEPRPGADDVAEDVDVRPEGVERRLQLLLLAVEQREQVVDLRERGADLGLVVGSDAAELPGQVAGVDQQQVHGLLALPHLLEDQVAVLHQRHEV